ncbi:phosphoribosyltransferase family protein [Hugenholtzia roseola]|uniref:phosphoribosyltransferase family protein n=1 Tax=Hugenholtzia roseola TaxID=1002 RepID=UPI00047B644D|nr:phosphoribosyltransferase family protein [Hugenholtzia roseola]
MPASPQNRILTAAQTLQKIRRLAYEIYEQNFGVDTLILAGIQENGYVLAQRLKAELLAIAPIEVELVSVELDKLYPTQSKVGISVPLPTLEQQVIILVDDVLNTGRTLAYSLRPFLEVPIKRLQTAVLVDRNHADFPIAADFVGYRLSTTLLEHVEVILKENQEIGVYLY